MIHPIRGFSLALAALAVLHGAAPPAAAQAPRQGESGSAGFLLVNSTSDNVTLSIVNQGLSAAVQGRSRGFVASLPFLFSSSDSTGFYRIRVANAATGNTLCEGVVQMKWTRRGASVECLVSNVPSRCQMPPAVQLGNTCSFTINHW